MSSSTWDAELEKAREFAKEWNRRNAAGNLSTGFLMERGDDIDQLVKAFQELDRRRSGLFDAGTGAPVRSTIEQTRAVMERTGRDLGERRDV